MIKIILAKGRASKADQLKKLSTGLPGSRWIAIIKMTIFLLYNTRGPCPVIPGPHYSKERQNSGNRVVCCCCPCQEDSISMPTFHIGPAVTEKTGTVNKGFSFIVMGDKPTKIVALGE